MNRRRLNWPRLLLLLGAVVFCIWIWRGLFVFAADLLRRAF